MQEQKKTLVLGASENPERYSYLAVKDLRSWGHEVVAVGARPGKIGDIQIQTEFPRDPDFHTVTIYLQPTRQISYYTAILELRPHRLIFNPGTENEELKHLALQAGIECLEACTLVMLRTGHY